MVQSQGFFGRFCSYPQGELSFLPQLIAAIPVIMSWAALPWTPWFDEEAFPYACIEWKENGVQNYQCFGLHLSDENYWDPSLGLGKRWGVAIQMGTLFGIISLLIGGTAYIFLLSSMCFSLTAIKLRIIQIAFLVASFFAFMVITALGVDECSRAGDRRRLDDFEGGSFSGGSSSSNKCEREGVHLMEGGVMFFLAFIFYIIAAGSVEFFRRAVSETEGEGTSQASSKVDDASSEEEKKLIGTTPDVEEVQDVDEGELGEADV